MRKLFADYLRIVSLFIIISACASVALAQEFSARQKNDSTGESVAGPAQSDDAFDKKNELAVWGGFAPDIPGVFGGSRRSTFGEIGLRYSRHRHDGKSRAQISN